MKIRNLYLHTACFIPFRAPTGLLSYMRSEMPHTKFSNFLTYRYCKYLSFLKSAFTAVHLQ